MDLPKFSVKLSGDWTRTDFGAVRDWRVADALGASLGATHRHWFGAEERVSMNTVAYLADVVVKDGRAVSARQVGSWTLDNLNVFLVMGEEGRPYVQPLMLGGGILDKVTMAPALAIMDGIGV